LSEVDGGPLYGYTGSGLRAWRQFGVNGAKTWYLYDGTNLLAEMDADGALTVVYTNGANGLVSKRAGSTSTFYTYDPQGSVSARLNDQGAVVSNDLYDAYGSLRDGNPNNDPVGYCGHRGYQGFLQKTEKS